MKTELEERTKKLYDDEMGDLENIYPENEWGSGSGNNQTGINETTRDRIPDNDTMEEITRKVEGYILQLFSGGQESLDLK